MAKISALPIATQLTGDEQLPIVQREQTKAATLAGFRDMITPFLQYWYKGEKGDTGAANSTYMSLAALKGAPITHGTYSLVTTAGRTDYAYIPGDFTGFVDDVLIVALNAVPITVGALVVSGAIQAEAFGVSVRIADNGPAFGRMLSVARYLAETYAIPPRIDLASGFYRFSGLDGDGQPLNWAVQGLHLNAQPGVVLIHTGSGTAFNVDGGATGGGVAMMKVTGGIVVRGTAQTLDGVYLRAVHHSTFDMEIQNIQRTPFWTKWTVCNEYWFRYSPVHRPSFTSAAKMGVLLDRRAPGEMTSACTFHNPLFEGIDGYGINCAYAIMNTFIGGTSESNAGGVFVSENSIFNTFIKLDMEVNTLGDIYCRGSYNEFIGVLSDSSSTFTGIHNVLKGGIFNTLRIQGPYNQLDATRYGSAGGSLIDVGEGTSKQSVLNITSGLLDLEKRYNPHDMLYWQRGDGLLGLVIGSADRLVAGGRAGDMAYFLHNGGRHIVYAGQEANVTIGPRTFGIMGKEAGVATLPPADDPNLTEAVAQALIAFGFATRT